VYATIATISGALLGFAITSISVQLAFLGGNEFEAVRKNPEYLRLFSDFKWAIFLFGITTLVALVGLMFKNPEEEITGLVLLSTMLWFSILSAAKLAHALRILWLAAGAHGMASRDQ